MQNMDYIQEILGLFSALYYDDVRKELIEVLESSFGKFKNIGQERKDEGLAVPEDVKELEVVMRNFLHENRHSFSAMDIDKGYYNKTDAVCLWCEEYLRYMKLYYTPQTFTYTVEYKTEDEEPQQSPDAAQESEIVLPPELDTDKARMVFQNALDAGYMEKQGNGYKWNKSKALLAYMCGRLIFGDEINGELEYKRHDKGKLFPDSAVCKLFNLDTRLSNSRLQMENAPRGYKKIDELFTNQEDSI